MTYEGMALTDMQMLEVMTVARRTGALVMVHAENFDMIRFMVDKLEEEARSPRNTTRPPGRSRSSASDLRAISSPSSSTFRS